MDPEAYTELAKFNSVAARDRGARARLLHSLFPINFDKFKLLKSGLPTGGSPGVP
jgi:hypothetical protein